MKTKNIPINLKQIPSNLALLLLTAGASLILGFLSFSGMYALTPLLPLAWATFALSTSYEGEIYRQNIKNSLKKLLQSSYLENHLAKEYLLSHFPKTENPQCPQFFKDYKETLLAFSQYEHKKLSRKSKKRQQELKQKLQDMESWFAKQLFLNTEKGNKRFSPYAQELQQWLALHEQEAWQKRLEKRRTQFKLVKGFSTLAAVFMGLGSTYLIVEAFSAIPLLAALPFGLWPVIIVPMAIVAGAAYGLLTYNAVTDLINNNTLVKWYNKLREDLRQGITVRNVLMTATAIFLVTLAVGLTICTAGTWWTIATNARPLFAWMGKMPSFIMGVINPIITGASAIFFNIQNTAESLELVDELSRSKKNIFRSIADAIVHGYQHIRATENWVQILNPFRIIIKLTVTPLQILLFFGHLISIAFTADRMPGLPQIVSALIAIISEGFEDAHYFIPGHHHEEKHHHHHRHFKTILQEHLQESGGHHHDTDIPTQLLKWAASPLYLLASFWDMLSSKRNKIEETSPTEKHPKHVLSFLAAWRKQKGTHHEDLQDQLVKKVVSLLGAEADDEKEEEVQDKLTENPTWQKEQAVFLIDEQVQRLKKSYVHPEVATKKASALQTLKKEIQASPDDEGQWEKRLKKASEKRIYNQHRLFAIGQEKTETQAFIEELPHRIGLTAS